MGRAACRSLSIRSRAIPTLLICRTKCYTRYQPQRQFQDRCNHGHGWLRSYLFAVRSFGHGSCDIAHGPDFGDVLAAGKTVSQQTGGFGDPMLEFDINLIGPRSQKTFPTVATSPASRLTASWISHCRSARIRQYKTTEHRPESLVRTRWRAHYRTAVHGFPAVEQRLSSCLRYGFRRQHGLRWPDDELNRCFSWMPT